MPHRARLFIGLLALVGCNPKSRQDQLREISSGHVGCAPARIAISDDSGGSWLAECNGKAFRCSVSGGSTTYHPGTSGYSYRTATGQTVYSSGSPGSYSHNPGTAHCTEDAEATAAAQTPAAVSSEPMTVHIGSARFKLPGGFRADPYQGHKTYHPASGWGRFVYLDVESHEGNAQTYAEARFADRTIKRVRVSGDVKIIATKHEEIFNEKMQLTTMVEVVDGDAYALTCADAEQDDESMSSFCTTVLKSFRLKTSE